MPALNELLSPWGVAFGDSVLDGEFSLRVMGDREVAFSSGTDIVRFPEDGVVVATSALKVSKISEGTHLVKLDRHSLLCTHDT